MQVRCTEFVMPRLVLKGATPEARHQDKLSTYELCEGELVNDRACYAQQVRLPAWRRPACAHLRRPLHAQPPHFLRRATTAA